MGFGVIDFAVVGAVHRFQQKLFPVFGRVNRLKRILSVFSVVARRNVEFFAANVRRYHVLVARPKLHPAQKPDQVVAQHGPTRCPERQTCPNQFVEIEQFQFAAQFAVIALFGCFQGQQVGI